MGKIISDAGEVSFVMKSIEADAEWFWEPQDIISYAKGSDFIVNRLVRTKGK